MYIKKIYDSNIGPIKDSLIEFPFNSNSTPKPVIIVGENGSGKSTLLSNIVDAFYEVAGEAFSDARQPSDREGYQYYKAISNSEIHLGQKYLCSYIAFEDTQCSPSNIDYVFKSGAIDFNVFNQNSRISLRDELKWDAEENHKKVIVTKANAEKVFSKNVLCYFGPERYEKPNWMGNKYYHLSDFEHPSVKARWAGEIGTPIEVKNVTPATLQWLLDVIVDSRCDIEQNGESLSIAHISLENLLTLGTARTNIETIMSKILGTDVYFSLNNRSARGSRFCINSKKDNAVLVPTLDALSTGQSALFNLFATIVRYADSKKISNSVNLNEITGIVVIDEIELHLHSTLQRDVLPELIALFPKVQFVISTHSPLFLLGMDKRFGNDGYEIYQMPDAQIISAECFSEFQKAYIYYSQTQTYHEEIKRAILAKNEKALIITEGSTDWKHLKAAFEHIKSNPDTAETFAGLEFEFLEYEPKNSKKDSALLLEMSNSQLFDMCKHTSAFSQARKLIFIADADDPDFCKKLGNPNEAFKKWGNGVYSFILPVPSHRSTTPKICIEHYYLDEELRTEVEIDGTLRRIYMGNEFDHTGISNDRTLFCYERNSCGKDKICIIDGSSEKRVIRIDDEQKKNIALPKSFFAEYVLEGKEPFAAFDYQKFTPVFAIIKEILEDK